jgi:hypothetical protein
MLVPIIVNFNAWATENDIQDFFERNNVDGVKTSMLSKKYAVDVPSEQQKKLVEPFRNDPLVKGVTV